MQGRVMAQRGERIPSLSLGEGRTTRLSHSAVPARYTVPCMLGGWQRGRSRCSMLFFHMNQASVLSLYVPEQVSTRGAPDVWTCLRVSACTQSTSGKLLSANLDPKPVEGSAIGTDQVFPPDMWRYNPKSYVFKWEMLFYSWPPLMGLQDELASLFCSIKVFPVQKDTWSFPHLEAVPGTTGMKRLQLQRVQLNTDVNNTLSSA